MQIEIYNMISNEDKLSITLESICDSFSSLLWDVEYYSCGAFEVYIAASPQNIEIFQTARIVGRDDDKEHYGLIESVQLEKKNGKLRPLGVPSFKDKIVQDIIRMYLEAIYEPIFSDRSHGFRPNRSCHTALQQLNKGFNGIKWFIEGDIKGCFDNIDHAALLSILSRKIKDSRFINLIRKFLKAGYMEDWKYYATYSGTPQGGILSPILANIYLNELDLKMEELKKEFDKPARYTRTHEYNAKSWQIEKIRHKINKSEDADEKAILISELRQLRKELRKIPAKDPSDKNRSQNCTLSMMTSPKPCRNISEETPQNHRSRMSTTNNTKSMSRNHMKSKRTVPPYRQKLPAGCHEKNC